MSIGVLQVLAGGTGIASSSASVLSSVGGLSLPSQSVIGGIVVQVTIDEEYEDELEITENPVQVGANLTDHSFKRPMEAVLRCGWSNSSLGALAGAVAGLFSGGAVVASDYVGGVYAKLLQLQESRQPLAVSTSLRNYGNMLIRSLRVRRDQETSQVLMVEASLKHVILADTSSSQLPSVENQASPASTAQTVHGGAKQLLSGNPTPAGALPPSSWTGNA